MAYDIETNVPVPNSASTGGVLKYPWDRMEHGNSFFEPLDDGEEPKKTYRRVINSGKAWLSRHKDDHELVARRVTEDGVDGYRFWLKKVDTPLPTV